jgi:hypothetical protein
MAGTPKQLAFMYWCEPNPLLGLQSILGWIIWVLVPN